MRYVEVCFTHLLLSVSFHTAQGRQSSLIPPLKSIVELILAVCHLSASLISHAVFLPNSKWSMMAA
jgi:hypothetical protein